MNIPSNTLTEEELIVLLKKKDEKSYHYLYDHYSAALYGVALRVLGSKEYAEEVLQDAFIKIWKNIEHYDSEKGRLYTWMINIARNTAIDYLKSKGYKRDQMNQPLPKFVHNSKEFSESEKEENMGLDTIVSRLKTEWRELIELAYYKGYTQKEIAEQLNIPLGTVKTRTKSALLQLKSFLKDFR